MGRTRARERYFQRQRRMEREGTSVALGTAASDGGPLVPTRLTRDTCCALGVHSEGCGCLA